VFVDGFSHLLNQFFFLSLSLSLSLSKAQEEGPEKSHTQFQWTLSIGQYCPCQWKQLAIVNKFGQI